MKKLLIFISMVVLTLTLTLALSGCSGSTDEFEGKNIVTFDVNGGVLNYVTSSTQTNLKFAYYPGTYIVDPTTIAKYSIAKNGYDFTGWYTDKDSTPSSKWDFKTIFDVESLTLYAGWEKSVKYTYSVYYVDESDGTEHKLGVYDVLAGGTFSDWSKYANKREGYTSMGFYSDKELTADWDSSFKHPGGESDCDIAVYVKYIEGEWEIASNFDQLKRAISRGNVYLTADIDCEGKELTAQSFSGIFNGNGYKISNIKVAKGGVASTPTSAIFMELTSTAEINHVTFENVTFDFTEIKESTSTITVTPKVAALAVDMQAGAKVKNVSITGNLVTNYAGELPCINSVYFYEEAPDDAVMAGVDESFSANITITVN